MQSKARPNKSFSQDQVDCCVKWIRLKRDKKFLQVSKKLRDLKDHREATYERFAEAHKVYESMFDSVGPKIDGAQKRYWEAKEEYQKANDDLENKEQEVCRRFGLFMWWDPDDPSITIDNAQAVFGPSFLVEVFRPPLGQPRTMVKASKDRKLILEVNLDAPLEKTEQSIGRLLRLYRSKPKTRNRPDKNAEALESWFTYENIKQFSAAAKELNHPVNTVKAQYVRACVLIYGKRPTGSIKQRRAGIVRDPAGEYQAHFGSCSRCQKAETADKICPRFLAFVNQDTKALLGLPSDLAKK